MRYFSAAAMLGAVAGLALLLTGVPVSAQGNQWGTVKGQIVYGEEKLPEVMFLDVNKDQKDCLAKGKIASEDWVINPKNKGVKWVFVWLTPVKDDLKIDINPALQKINQKEVVIDQPCCRFEPHAVGMREGQVLIAKNSSPITHNFLYSGNPTKGVGGNPAIAPMQQVEIKDLPADEKYPISISCSIHGWMKSYVRVFDHPYFAVTDDNGNFVIKDAPAGQFRLKSWLGGNGWRGGAKGKNGELITIKGGAVTNLGKLEIKPN